MLTTQSGIEFPQISAYGLFVHCGLLGLAFCVFTPTSVLIARHFRGWFRKRGYDWYQWHLNIQLIGHVLTGLGIVIPFCFMIDVENFYHFRHVHGWFGLLIAFLTLIMQPLLGTIDERYPEEDEQAKLYRHSVIGRAIYLSVLIVMYLGIIMTKPPNAIFSTPNEVQIHRYIELTFLTWSAILMVAFFSLEIKKLLWRAKIRKKKTKNSYLKPIALEQ